MDRVPQEVLSDIFFKALPKKDEIDHKAPLRNSISSPLYVSLVCKHWREAALSSRELWSSLCIKYNESASQGYHESASQVVDTWLQRSRDYPLDFCIWFNPAMAVRYKGHARFAIGHIIRALLREQHRWRNVDFRWNTVPVPPDLPVVELTNMPSLVSLTFQMSLDPYCASDGDRARIHLGQSPRLKQLDLAGHYTLEVGERLIAPLSGPVSLVYLRGFQDISPALAFLDFLRVVPNLRDLRVSSLGDPDNLFPSLAQDLYCLVLDLRRFKLDLDHTSIAAVEHLRLPALQDLDLNFNHYNTGQAFLRLVERSRPPMVRLQLKFYYGSENDLIDVLRLLPSLEQFHISYCDFSPWFLQMLTPKFCIDFHHRAKGIIICPRLRLFGFIRIFRSREKECATALYSMVSSRAEHLETLDRIWINNELVAKTPFSPDAIHLLEKSFHDKDVLMDSDDTDYLTDLQDQRHRISLPWRRL